MKISSVESALITMAERMPPDELIGGPPGAEYMRRWYIDRDDEAGTRGNTYLHQMMHSDDDRALHDHPWESWSLCLRGQLIEVSADDDRRVIRAGDYVHRAADFAHRLIVPPRMEGQVWTLFITCEKVREWGFHCPNGWRHWKEYCRDGAPGEIGRGCGP